MTDIKQSVRELREALRFVGAISYTEKLIRLGKACKELLPVVLDRLGELERANLNLTEAYYRADANSVAAARHCHELRAERDAIRAKFAEFRAAVDQWVGMGSEADEDDVSALHRILTRFPALDSSETTDGREG